MRAARRNLAGCLLLAALSLSQAPLLAQPAGTTATTDAARAVERGRQALALYQQSEWPEALARFREADALYHSPVFVLYTARCLRKLSRLVEARAALEQLVGEALDAHAPAPWQKARNDARLELTELRGEIPSISIVIRGDSGSTLLELDGRAAQRGRPLEVDPGEHLARVTAGARRKDVIINVLIGTHEQVVLSLPSHGSAGPIARPSYSPPSAPYWPGWIVAGTGAVALTAGGVVGILALNKTASLREHPPAGCDQTRCLASRKDAVDEHFAPARHLALASDILWLSGAVLAASGATLIVLHAQRSKAPAAAINIYPGGASYAAYF